MMEWSVDDDGYVALPQGVGLGVEMDDGREDSGGRGE